ncbi:uncharacterized protein N7482_001574 [Penicillium canariense]|uniref:Trichodiene oxygenase n=1 Tax=Penicillium canariense TaxID=189055 RepID=A0A9W9LUA8_9EURO|nr:uncharacterized protein N7482_001574 [Penicillium canariense]KAJ5175697.1 hypothetical protein N7482_001574 [Penicillium canariense]
MEYSGPVVRINPFEIHVQDPEFYRVLYTGSSSRRDKWPWAARMFGNNTSVFSTISHAHHRVRRAALNPIFSKTAIFELQDDINVFIGHLCNRLDGFAVAKKPVNAGLAFACLAGDVISKYCFGEPFRLLDDPEFAPDWVNTISAPSELSHLIKQFPWLVPLLAKLPLWLVYWISPAFGCLYTIQQVTSPESGCFEYNLLNVLQWMNLNVQEIIDKRIGSENKNNSQGAEGKLDVKTSSCVFDMLLQSRLPVCEKTVERLKGEGQTLIGAGTLTMVNVLKTVVFHTVANPLRLYDLLKELDEAFPDQSAALSLRKLEKLPILTSYITEGLRLAYGVTHRLQLLADEPLSLHGWHIPPRTPVSMTSIFMHDNVKIFPEPRQFCPERWLDNPESRTELLKHFVPFGKGTRMCLGMHLAWAELYLVLGTLFRRYNISLYETTVEDVEMAHDFFDPVPKLDSKGLRIIISTRHRK